MTESVANSMSQITWVIILWILRHQPSSLVMTRVDLTIRVFYNHLCQQASSLVNIPWVLCNHTCHLLRSLVMSRVDCTTRVFFNHPCHQASIRMANKMTSPGLRS